MRTGRSSAALDVARGVITALACTLAGMLALGLAAGYTGITDGAIQTLNQCLKIVSVLVGTLLAVRPGGQQGLVKGALVGVLYMAIGLGAVSMSLGAGMDWQGMAGEMLISAAVGAAAGALLANMPAPGRRKAA